MVLHIDYVKCHPKIPLSKSEFKAHILIIMFISPMSLSFLEHLSKEQHLHIPRHWFPIASTIELDPKRPTPVRLDGLDLVVWQAGRLKEGKFGGNFCFSSFLAKSANLFFEKNCKRQSMCNCLYSTWVLHVQVEQQKNWVSMGFQTLQWPTLSSHGDNSSHCRCRDRKMQKTVDGGYLALLSFFLVMWKWRRKTHGNQ